MTSFEIRTISGDDEIEAILPVVRTALLAPAAGGVSDPEARRASFEPGRNYAAFEKGRAVGFAGMFSFETTVPGGRHVATGGLTRVGVLPTHRRRGILTALLRAQLDDVVARGEALSSLRASEATIYGRFGYGLAAPFADHEIPTTKAAFAVAPDDDGGTVELVDRDDLLRLVPAVYDAVGRSAVGAVSRPRWWWVRSLEGLLDAGKVVPRWVAVHRDAAGAPDGFVDYRADRRTDPVMGAFDTHVATITDLFAGTPSAYAALWRHVLDRDLVGTVRAEGRPLDEPLRHRLANPRALRTVHVADEQWVRLVDVGAALAARSYPDAGSVTVAVDDRFLPANTGTWRVGGADAGSRTDDPADLRCAVDALGAAYLGGTSVAELAHAGRVEECTPGAVARADLLLGVRPLPWCGTWF